MIDENFLDMATDFEILNSSIENEKAMSAWMYELDAVADHWSSYYE